MSESTSKNTYLKSQKALGSAPDLRNIFEEIWGRRKEHAEKGFIPHSLGQYLLDDLNESIELHVQKFVQSIPYKEKLCFLEITFHLGEERFDTTSSIFQESQTIIVTPHCEEHKLQDVHAKFDELVSEHNINKNSLSSLAYIYKNVLDHYTSQNTIAPHKDFLIGLPPSDTEEIQKNGTSKSKNRGLQYLFSNLDNECITRLPESTSTDIINLDLVSENSSNTQIYQEPSENRFDAYVFNTYGKANNNILEMANELLNEEAANSNTVVAHFDQWKSKFELYSPYFMDSHGDTIKSLAVVPIGYHNSEGSFILLSTLFMGFSITDHGSVDIIEHILLFIVTHIKSANLNIILDEHEEKGKDQAKSTFAHTVHPMLLNAMNRANRLQIDYRDWSSRFQEQTKNFQINHEELEFRLKLIEKFLIVNKDTITINIDNICPINWKYEFFTVYDSWATKLNARMTTSSKLLNINFDKARDSAIRMCYKDHVGHLMNIVSKANDPTTHQDELFQKQLQVFEKYKLFQNHSFLQENLFNDFFKLIFHCVFIQTLYHDSVYKLNVLYQKETNNSSLMKECDEFDMIEVDENSIKFINRVIECITENTSEKFKIGDDYKQLNLIIEKLNQSLPKNFFGKINFADVFEMDCRNTAFSISINLKPFKELQDLLLTKNGGLDD